MRVPPTEAYSGWFAGVGLFIAGMIVGAAMFLAVYQQNFSLVIQEYDKLKVEAEKLRDAVDTYQKNKNKQLYIGKIDVIVEPARVDESLDPAVISELSKRIRTDLKSISGKSVSTIKEWPDLPARLIDGHVYRGVYEKDYTISVRRMFAVQTDLILYVAAKEAIRN